MKIYSVVICFMLFLLVSRMTVSTSDVRHHSVKIFLTRSYSGPNVGKYGLEQLRIPMLFTQCTYVKTLNFRQNVATNSLQSFVDPLHASVALI